MCVTFFFFGTCLKNQIPLQKQIQPTLYYLNILLFYFIEIILLNSQNRIWFKKNVSSCGVCVCFGFCFCGFDLVLVLFFFFNELHREVNSVQWHYAEFWNKKSHWGSVHTQKKKEEKKKIGP